MRAQPENQHIKFNVDVKVQNDPAKLFGLMHTIISAQDGWETRLAPRILLGLWHPRFIPHAKTILPYCKRSFIGVSLTWAREYFWESCAVFSINFTILASWEGARFREECKRAGKKVAVWTVNEREQMLEVRWPPPSRGFSHSFRELIGCFF